MKPVVDVYKLSKKYTIAHQKSRLLRNVLEDVLKKPLTIFSVGRKNTETFWALKNISFSADRGEAVGIIGENGAGKSTLLKILAGIALPTAGNVVLRGSVGSLLEAGAGFQPELTGRENVFLSGTILGIPKKHITKKFDEIVAFSGIKRFLDTPVKYYSSGMYIRLAFSVAVQLAPDILIVDEVLAVGDEAFRQKSLTKMEEFVKRGKTIVFVSHNLGAIKKLCTRVILLKRGKIEKIGNTDDIVTYYQTHGKRKRLQKKETPVRQLLQQTKHYIIDAKKAAKKGGALGKNLAPGSHHYRAYVGPSEKYDLVGSMQFTLLTSLGLREHHCLLDIGCGSLRAGKLFIPFLLPQRYFGIEPQQWLIDAGIQKELSTGLIKLKQPTFSNDTNFSLGTFGKKFDFLLAHSIFSHASQEQINRCLFEARKVMKETSIFAATFVRGKKNYTGNTWVYPACTTYTTRRMKQLVDEHDMILTLIDWPHPNQQQWMLIRLKSKKV